MKHSTMKKLGKISIRISIKMKLSFYYAIYHTIMTMIRNFLTPLIKTTFKKLIIQNLKFSFRDFQISEMPSNKTQWNGDMHKNNKAKCWFIKIGFYYNEKTLKEFEI